MRELKLVTADSDAQSLVLVPADTADTADASGDLAAQTISGYTDSDAPEEFFIVVTDDPVSYTHLTLPTILLV